MKYGNTLATAILAISMVGASQAATITAQDFDDGTTGDFEFEADNDLKTRTLNGLKGLGIDQGTDGEIDIGVDNEVKFSRTDGASFGLASTSLAFLYDGPEFGDVQERAEITGKFAAGGQSEVIVENVYTNDDDTDFKLSVDGSIDNTLITGFKSNRGSPGRVDLGAIFGNQSLDSITYSAINGPNCGDGNCNNNSDYSIASITTKAVPEPGTLSILGIGLAGLGFRFARR